MARSRSTHRHRSVTVPSSDDPDGHHGSDLSRLNHDPGELPPSDNPDSEALDSGAQVNSLLGSDPSMSGSQMAQQFSSLVYEANDSEIVNDLPPDDDPILESEVKLSSWDEATDFITPEEEQNAIGQLWEDSENAPEFVPAPSVAMSLTAAQQIAEFYSPPRILSKGREFGLTGHLSLDLITGWDFELPHIRQLSFNLLAQLQIVFLMLSPPCTIFSQLQRLWNFKKMSKVVMEAKIAQGMRFLEHSMECARIQIENGAYFCFEHPAGASSWDTDCVRAISKRLGVRIVSFDQCMFGLRSKVSGQPMRKRTKLMTNSPSIYTAFHGRYCDRSHLHQSIQGSEGGVKRSTWAQVYPPPMVTQLAECACQICR